MMQLREPKECGARRAGSLSRRLMPALLVPMKVTTRKNAGRGGASSPTCHSARHLDGQRRCPGPRGDVCGRELEPTSRNRRASLPRDPPDCASANTIRSAGRKVPLCDTNKTKSYPSEVWTGNQYQRPVSYIGIVRRRLDYSPISLAGLSLWKDVRATQYPSEQ